MRVLVEAYGCAMNRGEAEEFIDALLEAGHTLASGSEDAEAFAIFTCGVIDTTERRMLRRIRELAGGGEKPLLVGGCLPNICSDKIRKAAPNAYMVGPAEHLAGISFISSQKMKLNPARRISVGILPVATGCTGDCSYCITRKARGALRSRRPENVASRLDSLVASGAVEVQLCAQDMAAYGADIGSDLGRLVEDLSARDGNFMMRIGMMNPATLLGNPDNILRAYESPKVFKFLHLPVQSGSDAVLERMNRRHTAEDFRSIVGRFRERFPGLALSTDIIIGFPGEAESDFRMSMSLMEDIKPDIINVTRFSARPGTPAHSMKPKVPGWRAKEWSREMTELRFRITAENYSAMAGSVVRALATERRKPGTTFLRTENYRPVVVRGDIPLGEWRSVMITGKAKTHLVGKIAE